MILIFERFSKKRVYPSACRLKKAFFDEHGPVKKRFPAAEIYGSSLCMSMFF
jgi:hypothetical protein